MTDTHETKTPRGVALTQQLTWDDLRVFSVLAATCSVRAAAIRLELNPSTVSRRLSSLEESLNTKLFERLPEGLRLTMAGREAHELADAMGGQVQELKRRLAGRQQALSGLVKVTTAEAAASVVAEAMALVSERFPLLQIELVVDDQLASLMRHEAEVALRMADVVPESLVGRKLTTAAVGVYAARSYLERKPRTLELAEHHWIEWPAYVQGKAAYRWLEERFPKRRIVLQANCSNGVYQALHAGVGVAVLSCVHAESDPTLIRLERLPVECSTPVWLLTHEDMRSTPRVRAVMTLLEECVGSRESWFAGLD